MQWKKLSTLLRSLAVKWILLIGILLIILASGIFGYEIRQNTYLILFTAVLVFTATLSIIWRAQFFPNGLPGGLTGDWKTEMNESGLRHLLHYREHRLFKNNQFGELASKLEKRSFNTFLYPAIVGGIIAVIGVIFITGMIRGGTVRGYFLLAVALLLIWDSWRQSNILRTAAEQISDYREN